MATEFKLPEVGENVEKADIGNILVKEGDEITAGQVVMEIETDKAVFDLPCTVAGRVAKVLVKQGETVKIGQALLAIESAAAPSAKPAAAPQAPAAAEKPVAEKSAAKPEAAKSSGGGGSVEFKLPAVGENVDKADVGNVAVKEGDEVTAGQVVMEIETDKAVFDLPCPHAGKVTKVLVKQGETVKVGQPLLELLTAGGSSTGGAPEKAPPRASQPAATQPAPAPKAATATATMPRHEVSAQKAGSNGEAKLPAPAGPATRRLARELGVDLFQVKGSGPNGRITQEDVQGYVKQRLSAPATGGGPVIPPLPDFSQYGPIERLPLNKIGKMSAVNLSLSWQVVPHVTQHEMVDITELEAGRKRFGSRNESAPKVTMTVLAVKAIVTVLKAFPNFNASFDSATNEIIHKKYYNIGVAVDTEQGLLVPVIKDADKQTVVELAAGLTDLSVKARARKLAPGDMQGGTFTITNLGGIGGSFFTPIVNYPEVAILGMSRAVQQYVLIDGRPEIRLMMPLSLSYDHRVVNGADAARFIVKLASLLADPFKLLSEV